MALSMRQNKCILTTNIIYWKHEVLVSGVIEISMYYRPLLRDAYIPGSFIKYNTHVGSQLKTYMVILRDVLQLNLIVINSD